MAYDQTQGSIPDFGFLPPNFNGDVQTFFTDNNGSGSQKWYKPRGVTMCYMVCIGGGGGGGGGLTGATTTARGGGGGGASSCISKMTIPAIFIPDVLIIQVGAGGAGGSGSGIAGSSGGNSFISYGVGVTAIGTIPNLVLAANGSTWAGGGGAGATSGHAAGGTVPTVNLAQGAVMSWSMLATIVGTAGATGGAPANGGSTSNAWALTCVSSGTGGAGVTAVNTGFAGGVINLTAAIDLPDLSLSASGQIAGGVAGSASAAGNGNAGIQLWKPFYMTGGSGGGSSDGSTGGNGGNGGIGCGGGGGGAGVTGGAGGNGGDGFVCIISW